MLIIQPLISNNMSKNQSLIPDVDHKNTNSGNFNFKKITHYLAKASQSLSNFSSSTFLRSYFCSAFLNTGVPYSSSSNDA